MTIFDDKTNLKATYLWLWWKYKERFVQKKDREYNVKNDKTTHAKSKKLVKTFHVELKTQQSN